MIFSKCPSNLSLILKIDLELTSNPKMKISFTDVTTVTTSLHGRDSLKDTINSNMKVLNTAVTSVTTMLNNRAIQT